MAIKTLYNQIRVALIASITLMIMGCGGGSNGSNGNGALMLSGVQGQATRGPISPTSQQGQPNDAPLPGVMIIVKQMSGAEVARQTSDLQGNYKIGVAPGSYQLVGLPPNGKSGPPTPQAPQSVTVEANQYVTVNVSYDSGIR